MPHSATPLTPHIAYHWPRVLLIARIPSRVKHTTLEDGPVQYNIAALQTRHKTIAVESTHAGNAELRSACVSYKPIHKGRICHLFKYAAAPSSSCHARPLPTSYFIFPKAPRASHSSARSLKPTCSPAASSNPAIPCRSSTPLGALAPLLGPASSLAACAYTCITSMNC